MSKLSVNLNKIALLRNQREIGIPNLAAAAQTCISAGAHGITVHPRPDQRHIRFSDVELLEELLTVEFNIEGNPCQEHLMPILRRAKPTQATLVPDDPAQATSDHGWDLSVDAARLGPLISELKGLGCRVSLFMDPLPENMAAAAELGADRVELYTEPYAAAHRRGDSAAELSRYVRAAEAAQAAGLGVNAGHDLNLDNLPMFLAEVPGLLEVSIGHALIADALELGLAKAVAAYLNVLEV
jgi:pyridoxine 5-phosphate synthase